MTKTKNEKDLAALQHALSDKADLLQRYDRAIEVSNLPPSLIEANKRAARKMDLPLLRHFTIQAEARAERKKEK